MRITAVLMLVFVSGCATTSASRLWDYSQCLKAVAAQKERSPNSATSCLGAMSAHYSCHETFDSYAESVGEELAFGVAEIQLTMAFDLPTMGCRPGR